MTLSLRVDMNLSPAGVALLEDAGFVAVHWSAVGRHDAPDSILFSWARQNSYIVFTHDLDFGSLLAVTGAEAPSVFQIRTEDVSPQGLGSHAISLLRRFEQELASGALIGVDDGRNRVRILPLLPN